MPTPTFRQKLAHHLTQQASFARGYAPLYARLFGQLATWCAAGDSDPLVDWLTTAPAGRPAFDVTLLLAAGLHRAVLRGDPAAAQLARWYPTGGGTPPEPDDPAFPTHLRQAILALRPELTPFIQTATVQTNETARGLAWLLPLGVTGWTAVHLLDLGASAGLNLVADQRRYRLVDDAGGERLVVGDGRSQPFITHCRGPLDRLPPPAFRLPRLLSRTGVDVAPFHLDSPAAELTLMSFVWADQPARLARLKEAIAALKQVNADPALAPVTLHPANLPDDLPRFLAAAFTRPDQPLVLYNTYVTQYLAGKGAVLADKIDEWARRQPQPVAWLQWEPARDGRAAPEYGWCAWTADLWDNGRHRRWQLAWVHPHGTHVEWTTGWADWVDFWS